MDHIKRDANKCEEGLKNCRNSYLKFGIETAALKEEELKKGSNHFDIKSKRKPHKVLTMMLITEYKK